MCTCVFCIIVCIDSFKTSCVKFPLSSISGYLAVSLLLHENHELIMLLINTLQKVREYVSTAPATYSPVT